MPNAPQVTSDPPDILFQSTPVQLTCGNCAKVYPYTQSLPGPGGPIGVLFYFSMFGCPNCGDYKVTVS